MCTPLSRFLMLVHGMKELLGLAPRDVLYSALPMYHAAAGVIVLGAAMSQGLTMVSRRKFSATRFWQDCHQHGVTVSSLGSVVVRMCRLRCAGGPVHRGDLPLPSRHPRVGVGARPRPADGVR